MNNIRVTEKLQIGYMAKMADIFDNILEKMKVTLKVAPIQKNLKLLNSYRLA